jgi:hypothetical protein
LLIAFDAFSAETFSGESPLSGIWTNEEKLQLDIHTLLVRVGARLFGTELATDATTGGLSLSRLGRRRS